MQRKNSESLQQQRDALKERMHNDNEENKVQLEKEQIRNVYTNTLYFFVLSFIFSDLASPASQPGQPGRQGSPLLEMYI